MNHRLSELHLRRGRLLERIATQRVALGQEMRPVHKSLQKADRLVARVYSMSDYVKQHPSVVGLGVAVLLLVKTERVWRWVKRGFLGWRAWRALRNGLLVSRVRARS